VFRVFFTIKSDYFRKQPELVFFEVKTTFLNITVTSVLFFLLRVLLGDFFPHAFLMNFQCARNEGFSGAPHVSQFNVLFYIVCDVRK
jgi:hypothetical protein